MGRDELDIFFIYHIQSLIETKRIALIVKEGGIVQCPVSQFRPQIPHLPPVEMKVHHFPFQ